MNSQRPEQAAGGPGPLDPWRDPDRSPGERADALVAVMSLEEKAAQLVGVWVGADASGGGVAPHQEDLAADPVSWPDVIASGLGQLTRPFGTAPVDPVAGARSLAASQRQIVSANRFGIPAQVHEECLTGFAAWRATVHPAPLTWGASFDPDLVEVMGRRIGASLRAAGVHQGLAPVVDVTRDYRWGRTEETIGEDPVLVGAIGAAYVRGVEASGVVATLKHFATYSASRGGRNLAPVGMGPRELAEVILPPFEMALRLGGARSVMNSYTERDGVPIAADASLLTDLLRGEWGFTGVVVSDYFAIRFLERLHGVADTAGRAAALALRAGIDVELPTVDTYGAPLIEAVKSGAVDEALLDRALRRVLVQKVEQGLLDPDWSAEPADVEALALDDEASRDVALRLAREGVVLIRNDGVLPLRPGARVALVGPLADDPMGLLGCYTFPAHVGVRYPDHPLGVEIPSLREALAARVGDLTHTPGCGITEPDTSGLADAVAAARAADVCVLVVGDRAGLFGRGTSGEGCDAEDLRLPGVQADLVEAVLATGTPVVLVRMVGRPYALGPETDAAAAVVESYFAGQCGGQALAEILTGAVEPSGRLPVSVPRHAGGLPGTYLTPPLGRVNDVSDVDPTPAYPFGHGIGYTSFAWSDAAIEPAPDGVAQWPVDGSVTAAVTVTNTGRRPGTEVVQVYLHDPVAQTTRPVVRLIGFTRVPLDPGARARVSFTIPADLTSFIGVSGERIVEPGDVELRLARSSGEVVATLPAELTGPERGVGHDRQFLPEIHLERAVRRPGS